MRRTPRAAVAALDPLRCAPAPGIAASSLRGPPELRDTARPFPLDPGRHYAAEAPSRSWQDVTLALEPLPAPGTLARWAAVRRWGAPVPMELVR